MNGGEVKSRAGSRSRIVAKHDEHKVLRLPLFSKLDTCLDEAEAECPGQVPKCEAVGVEGSSCSGHGAKVLIIHTSSGSGSTCSD